jgi:UDP-N-acetyl-D-galactosamine dehydrogenase
VDVYDPWALAAEVKHEYDIDIKVDLKTISNDYVAIVLAVSHQEFIGFEFDKYLEKTNVIYDVKGILPKEMSDGRL